MNQKDIIKSCKELGCCDGCCLRFLGLKNPAAYENVQQYVHKVCEGILIEPKELDEITHIDKDSLNHTRDLNETSDNEPPAKKVKCNAICVTCLGVLQEENWPQCYNMVKEVLDKKGYECETFACALSAPIASMVRERIVSLHLKELYADYDLSSLTPLKEAWKWSFGARLAAHVGKALDSGAVSPLLVTLTMEYPDEPQELEPLKALAPALFAARRAAGRRFGVEFTRRSVEQALAGAALSALGGVARAAARAAPVAVRCEHAPLYLGGRYIKLSRALPQTPWLVNGRRMMHSSVQETICEPIAALYRMSAEEAEHRLKFISAGREDVDVRCLGDGRPFAIEIADPTHTPSEAELSQLCEQISAGGRVLVRVLMPVTREDLAMLKKGEETKCKTYEALCIKLSAARDEPAGAEVCVTERDLQRLNTYCGAGGVVLQQRTPIRVLHRRPLLTRARRVLALSARGVAGAARLFVVRVRAEAGTYVKEWAHGDLGRTRPRLADALRADADILALDVAAVDLPWPPHAHLPPPQ